MMDTIVATNWPTGCMKNNVANIAAPVYLGSEFASYSSTERIISPQSQYP